MPFEPGDKWKGNANGRPKGSISVISALKRKLAEEMPEELQSPGEKKIWLDGMVEVMIHKAVADGDLPTIKEINDRVEGKAPQQTDITSGGEPLIIPETIAKKNEID